jgi:hypothetical protein
MDLLKSRIYYRVNMAFPVNFSNTNLPKRLNLLRSKGEFAGKSGRITPNSTQNDVERPTDPRAVDGWLQTRRNLAPVCGVLHVFARIAIHTPTERSRNTGERRSRPGKEMPRLHPALPVVPEQRSQSKRFVAAIGERERWIDNH